MKDSLWGANLILYELLVGCALNLLDGITRGDAHLLIFVMKSGQVVKNVAPSGR